MLYPKDYLIEFVNQNFLEKKNKKKFALQALWLLLQNNSLKLCVNKKKKQLTGNKNWKPLFHK